MRHPGDVRRTPPGPPVLQCQSRVRSTGSKDCPDFCFPGFCCPDYRPNSSRKLPRVGDVFVGDGGVASFCALVPPISCAGVEISLPQAAKAKRGEASGRGLRYVGGRVPAATCW